MKARELNKLLKEKSPVKIIEDYMSCKIFLTELQLEKVCNLGEHHGGCILGKGKKRCQKIEK